jgi:hypothetical protein
MARHATARPLRTVLIDTDVLIWYFRGNDAARSFLRRIAAPRRTASALTVMELIQGCRHRAELVAVKAFVAEDLAAIVYPDEAIARRAIVLLETHALGRGLRTVDALIAATALEASARLATANVKHYRAIAGLELMRFRPLA